MNVLEAFEEMRKGRICCCKPYGKHYGFYLIHKFPYESKETVYLLDGKESYQSQSYELEWNSVNIHYYHMICEWEIATEEQIKERFKLYFTGENV